MVVAEKESIEERIEEQPSPSDWIQLLQDKVVWKVENCGDIFPGAITPMGAAASEETAEFELRVDKAFTVAATGHKGNGKTLFLTRSGVIALVMGLPVWSNYPIEFNYINEEHKQRHCVSQPLDWNALFSLSKEMNYGVVIISEIQQWLDNRTSGRLNNRLFSYILRQTRKRHLSLWYDCFSLDTIDRRLPAETDVEVYCEDLRKTFWGKTKGTDLEEGEYIHLKCYARSNAWLGFTSFERGVSPEFNLYGKPFHRCYDTGFLHDPFEAMAGIELDLEKRKITNKVTVPLKERELRQVIEAKLDNGESSISSGELWKSAGIAKTESTKYGDLIIDLGLIRKVRTGKLYYDLSSYKESNET